ncbi:MAG: ATP-binding cassette domain-containing protein [Gammaproteobacteria bacterium]|nr:ATP-binding cassette domain-containing protein [Gammaproteobacteria bacterium]
MPLVTLDDISLDFGAVPILRHAQLVLEPQERVCLIGRNGAGKSTLLKIIAGEQAVDAGDIIYRQDLRISVLAQALPTELDLTVRDYVTGGLAHLRQLITDYHHCAAAAEGPGALAELAALQRRIDAEGGWHLAQRVETVLSELDLPEDRRLGELSGGWQRRVGLARALVSNPELLLLDEPTNHLDLATIEWLEARIRSFPGSVLFITHDRALLQALATRIVELDRTRLTSWPGDYRNFLRRKAESLHAEDLDRALFEKRLAAEEEWIRQGVKARRTRNEGRVRALEAMREEHEERSRLKRPHGARIHIEASATESGRKVIDLHQVSYGYGATPLIANLTLKIRRGERIGLIGNNGVGKSTLLNLMLGLLEPQSGTVKLGTNLEVGYFDQMRRDLDPEKTIAEVVGDGRDYIQLNGRDRHVIGYLRGFLFSAERAKTPIKALSGGERNRVILARLFTRASNLLVLDEPTNDLDVETMEVLEQKLIEYPGTLLVVSHDRAFLDRVITSSLVFEAGGKIERYPGGYHDWLARGRKLAETDNPNKVARAPEPKAPAGTAAPKKLSYKLQRELDTLPTRIGELESAIAAAQQESSAAGFYQRPYAEVQEVLAALHAAQRELDAALERWVELEASTAAR